MGAEVAAVGRGSGRERGGDAVPERIQAHLDTACPTREATRSRSTMLHTIRARTAPPPPLCCAGSCLWRGKVCGRGRLGGVVRGSRAATAADGRREGHGALVVRVGVE